jgi:hypothetical protein
MTRFEQRPRPVDEESLPSVNAERSQSFEQPSTRFHAGLRRVKKPSNEAVPSSSFDSAIDVIPPPDKPPDVGGHCGGARLHGAQHEL